MRTLTLNKTPRAFFYISVIAISPIALNRNVSISYDIENL